MTEISNIDGKTLAAAFANLTRLRDVCIDATDDCGESGNSESKLASYHIYSIKEVNNCFMCLLEQSLCHNTLYVDSRCCQAD